MRRSTLLALALIAACRSKAPETPAATAPATSDPAAASSDAPPQPAPADDADPNGGKGPKMVELARPPPCAPHVDSSDPDLKFSPAEVAYRTVKSGDKEVAQLVALDGMGACEFDTRRPASFLGLRMRLELPSPPGPHHYVLGEKASDAAVSFVAPGKGGAVKSSDAKGGIVDLMSVRGDVLSIGFNVKAPGGEVFGCFEAKPCP